MNIKILLLLLLLLNTLHAELKVGAPFPLLSLVDQFHEKVQMVTKGETQILFSSQKDVSSKIKSFLDTKEKGYLEKNHIVYISDISHMPSFVTKLFAIPKMKKFNFRVALIYDKAEGSLMISQKDKITVITLKDNTVTSIKFIKPIALFELFK